MHDANADLVKELRVPSDADDNAIQEALRKLFNAQVQEQIRDQSKSDAVEGPAVRAARSDSVSGQALKAQSTESVQALKASVRDQISLVQSQGPSSSLQAQAQISLVQEYQYQAVTVQTVSVQ